MLNLNTVQFSRVVMHKIIAKAKDDDYATVEYETEFINLIEDVENILRTRLVTAAGKDSKIFELEFDDIGAGSYYELIDRIHDKTDEDFFVTTRNIADRLAFSQTRKNIPGGYLFILEGRYGEEQKPLLIVIKAEPHEALQIDRQDGAAKLQLLKDIFLSPSQKLYKLGIVYEREEPIDDGEILAPNDSVGCLLFDEQFRVDGTPAEYFYKDFLGFSTKNNSKIQTFSFYEKTDYFIRNEIQDEEIKTKAISDLKHELRNVVNDVVVPRDFARRYFADQQLIDKYNANVLVRLPGSIIKDTTLIERRILNKKVDFSSRININGPDEGFDDNVEFIRSEKELEQLDPTDGNYTIVKIIGRPFSS